MIPMSTLSRRRKQGTGVGDGSAADGAAMKNGCVPEQPHVEEASQAELGAPEPAMDGPTGVGQIGRRPAPAHLHDGNFVALLDQTMS